MLGKQGLKSLFKSKEDEKKDEDSEAFEFDQDCPWVKSRVELLIKSTWFTSSVFTGIIDGAKNLIVLFL